MEKQILLKDIEEVKEFVNSASKIPYEIDLESGNVYIDAKSFLGVLTMGLKRKMNVVCQEENVQELNKLIKKYAVA